MSTEFILDYIDFLNLLNIIRENDNIRFKVKRKNYVCPPDQLGTVIEKHLISITIDGIDHPFSTAFVDPASEYMRIKYNDLFVDEILMCLGGEHLEFHEVGMDEIYSHVKRFEKRYFTEMIRKVIVEQKREIVENALLGLTEKEVRGHVISYHPTWAIGEHRAVSSRMATETIKAIRSIVAELYNDKIALLAPIRYSKNMMYGYEIYISRYPY